jgi:hypothetical protein
MRTEEIQHAREVDERIAQAWQEFWVVNEKVIEYRKKRDGAIKMVAQGYKHYANSIERHEAKIAEFEPQAQALREVAVDMEEEYEGWSRFFLVQHIHKSQYCSSFRPSTRIGWLPDVSGLTEAEAVAEYGAILCTICFPSAPVEWTRGKEDNSCPGSGKPINYALPCRRNYYSGNYATCEVCGATPGTRNGSYKIPKHKAK